MANENLMETILASRGVSHLPKTYEAVRKSFTKFEIDPRLSRTFIATSRERLIRAELGTEFVTQYDHWFVGDC